MVDVAHFLRATTSPHALHVLQISLWYLLQFRAQNRKFKSKCDFCHYSAPLWWIWVIFGVWPHFHVLYPLCKFQLSTIDGLSCRANFLIQRPLWVVQSLGPLLNEFLKFGVISCVRQEDIVFLQKLHCMTKSLICIAGIQSHTTFVIIFEADAPKNLLTAFNCLSVKNPATFTKAAFTVFAILQIKFAGCGFCN